MVAIAWRERIEPEDARARAGRAESLFEDDRRHRIQISVHGAGLRRAGRNRASRVLRPDAASDAFRAEVGLLRSGTATETEGAGHRRRGSQSEKPLHPQ